MAKYKRDGDNLFGSLKRKDGKVYTVPYYRFINDKGQSCRIPVEIYEQYKREGLSQDEILIDHADWYAKSNYEYRKQYKANIVARNERERIKNQQTGLSDEEIVEGYLADWKKYIKKWRAKNEQVTASNSN